MLIIFPILVVWLGYLAVRTRISKSAPLISLGLSFSGAFLLSTLIFEMLPELYTGGDHKSIGLFLSLGILLQLSLEYLSQGAEHGHTHHHGHSGKVPWLVIGSLCIHAFLEGIPLGGLTGLFWGVLVHKFTIALALSLLLMETKAPKFSSLWAIGVFSIMTPLGSFLSGQSLWPEHWNNYLNALAVGILLHIATVILFESSDGHRFNLRKFAVILGGFALGYLVG